MSLLINGFFAQFLRYSQKNPNGHVWREGVAEREKGSILGAGWLF